MVAVTWMVGINRSGVQQFGAMEHCSFGWGDLHSGNFLPVLTRYCAKLGSSTATLPLVQFLIEKFYHFGGASGFKIKCEQMILKKVSYLHVWVVFRQHHLNANQLAVHVAS